MIRKLLVAAILLLPAFQQSEPTVRIGLGQNAATVTVRSTAEFRVQGQPTRTARFSPVLAWEGALRDSYLARPTTLCCGSTRRHRYLVFPIARNPHSPANDALQFNSGRIAVSRVFGNTRIRYRVNGFARGPLLGCAQRVSPTTLVNWKR